MKHGNLIVRCQNQAQCIWNGTYIC